MTQEHIDLLFKEICARIPYGVKGINKNSCVSTPKGLIEKGLAINATGLGIY